LVTSSLLVSRWPPFGPSLSYPEEFFLIIWAINNFSRTRLHWVQLIMLVPLY